MKGMWSVRIFNNSSSFSIVAYLEDRYSNDYYFEYYREHNELNRIIHFNLSFSEEDNIKLIPNYYYNINLYNDERNNTYQLDSIRNKEFFHKLSLDNEMVWYIEFKINFQVTEKYAQEVMALRRDIDKIEGLKEAMLTVYEKGELAIQNQNDYNHWLNEKKRYKHRLDSFFEREILTEEDVIEFDSVIKEIIPKFRVHDRLDWIKIIRNENKQETNKNEKDKEKNDNDKRELLRRYNEIFQTLKDIKNYNKDREMDIPSSAYRILNYEGIGEVSMTTLFNIVNSKYFPIYSKNLSKYMNNIGFEILNDIYGNSEWKTAQKYNNYLESINEILESFDRFLNETKENYDEFNYFIRRELDLFKL
jgi:hypothetical protein